MIPELPTVEEVIARAEQVGVIQAARELNECMGLVRKSAEALIISD